MQFYNNTIHGMTKVRPIDFINKLDLNLKEIKRRMDACKRRAIDRENQKREEVKIDLKGNNAYIKNPTAVRQKVAKRFIKYHHTKPNKIDISQFRRPPISIEL